jgi:NitT/TauT family transport system substrate-binding protein
VYIADALGFFAKNGIEMSYVATPSGPAALQALAAKGADFIISDVITASSGRQNGVDVRLVAGMFKRFVAALQCRKSLNISGAYPGVMRQLVGKTIGVTSSPSGTDTYAKYTLIDAGVDPKSVQVLPVGGVPSLVAAIQSGRVDCVTSFQPMQQTLKGTVDTVVNWSAGQGPKIFSTTYILNALATSNEYATNNPKTVRSVAKAIRQAVEYASNPANAARIAAATTKFFPGTDAATLATISEEAAPAYGYKLSRGQVGSAIKVYKKVYNQDIPYPYSDYIAPTMMDLTAPTVQLTVTAKGNKATLAWRGVDAPGVEDVTDVASGVKTLQVQVSTGGGSWRTVSTKPTASFTLRKGATVRVRAQDKAGNTGKWVQKKL